MSDLDPEARAILDGGRGGDDPSLADRARIRASLMRSIAAGSVAGGTAIAAAGAAATATESAAAGALATKAGGVFTLGWKLLTGLAVLGVVSAGVVVSRAPASPAPATSPAALAPAQPTVAGAPAPFDSALAPVDGVPAPVAAPPPPADPAPLTAAPPRSPTDPVRSSPSPRPPVAAPLVPAPPPAADPPPVTAPPPPAPVAAPTAPSDTLMAETQRLREAHGALQGGDGARALALLEEQGAAGAQLREERAAARVLALCQLGKVDEARAAAARFLQESPRSPLADRVRASCGAAPPH